MLFNTSAVVDIVTRANIKRESERRLEFATRRFRDNVREIGVAFRDVNGPRGGVDKQCRVIAMLRRGDALVIEETRANFIDGIRVAAKRLHLLLAKRTGGKRPRNTLRHIDQRNSLRRGWDIL